MAVLKPILWWSLVDVLIALIFLAIAIFTKSILSVVASAILGLSALGKLIFTAFNY